MTSEAAFALAPHASEPPPGSVGAPGSGPYKFLDFYTEADEKSFAGRDREVREVVARICTNRTFVLYAPSGLGKTSMLLAAVFPALRNRSLTPIYVRTVGAPLANLATALGASDAATTPADLAALVRERSRQTTTVLVFDQFEEFFIHLRQEPQERREFARVIKSLVDDSSLNVRVVFSLREDYLAELDELRDVVPDLFINDYRLRPLTAFGTRQAIVQPLIHAGVPYDRRLLVKLVDLLADVRFDPVMLQILCTEVYRQAQSRQERESRHEPPTDDDGGAPRLTETDLDRAGGLEGVFRRYLDRVIANVPANMLLLTRTVLDNLITQEQTKRAVTRDTLVNADFSASTQEIDTVLGVLGLFRLVRSEQRHGQLWYELSHERLVSAVLDWLKLDEDFYRFRVARDLVANNCRGEVWRTNFDALLNEGVLRDVVARYARRFRFTPTELEFVYLSAVYRRADTSVWQPLLTPDACRAIVLMFLRHDSPQARIAGAYTAAKLPDPDGALGNVCVTLALHDQDEQVRRAAGAALGVLATAAHLDAIRAALDVSETRRAAMEAMGDLHRAGRDLSSFSIYRRRRARAVAHAALRRQHAEKIRLRAKAGAIAGLVASALWIFAIAIPMIVLTSWATGHGVLASPEMFVAAFYLIFIIPAGALFGWRIGRASAVQAVYDGREGRWFRALMRVKVVYLLSAYSAVATVVLAFTGGTLVLFLGTLVSVVIPLVLMLCVTGLVQIVKSQVLASTSIARMGLTSLLFSLEVACLPLALVLCVMVMTRGTIIDVEILALVGGLWVSVGVAVSTITLAVTAPQELKLEAKSAPRTRRVAVARLVLLLAMVAGFGVIYRFDSLPFPIFGREIELTPGKPVDVHPNLRVGFADSSYWHIASAAQPRWLRVSDIPDHVEVLIDNQPTSASRLVHLPPGPHTITLRGRTRRPSSDRVIMDVLPARLPDGVATGLIAAVLTRRPGTTTWVGALHGVVRQPDTRRVQLILIDSAPASSPALPIGATGDLDITGQPAQSGGAATTGSSRVSLRFWTEAINELEARSHAVTADVSPRGTWSAALVLTLTPETAKTAPDTISTVFLLQPDVPPEDDDKRKENPARPEAVSGS